MLISSARLGAILLFVLQPLLCHGVTFIDIWEFRVDGVESIEKGAVQQAIAPYLGAARTLDDVDKAAQAIQQLYQEAGYPVTGISVPQQDVVGGVITFQVEEAKVRRVRVAGSSYYSLEKIRESFPSLTTGQPLDINSLQQDVKKTNQLSQDLKVVPAVNAGPTPGALDIDLNVDDTLPLHGGFEVTNYNTENTTSTRVAGDIRYSNLWQKHHELSLQFQLTPENQDEVKVLAGSYLMPVGDKGSKLAAYMVLSDSQLAAVSDINVIGKGKIFGFRWIQPIAQSSQAVHSISAGLDYKDFDEELVFLGGATRETPISYTAFAVQYNLFRRSETVTDSFSSGFSFGARALNEAEEFNEKKSQADAGFALWKVDWKRNYELPKTWMFTHRLRGQVSESPLVSNEQLSAGGVSSVRGYFESQTQGDAGVILNLELQAPPFNEPWKLPGEYSGYIFYDAAKTFINEALPDQEDNISIASFGVGLRARIMDHWHFKLESGWPLKDEGEVNRGTVRTRASTRFEF